MKKKLYELKNQRKTHLDAAKAALDSGDGKAYDEAMAKVKEYNGEIEKVEKLLDEQERSFGYNCGAPGMDAGAGNGDEEPVQNTELSKLLSSADYKKTFCQALRGGVSSKRFTKGYEPLYKAMTLAGGEPSGSEGGFLVPVDFETRVITLAKEYVDLSAHAHVETVTSPIGWRNVELSAGRTPMSVVGEGQKIPQGAGPKFKRVDYSCKTYGDRVLVSADLAGNDEALLEYLAVWFAAKFVATKNSFIIGKLNELEFKAIAGGDDAETIAAIKRIFNKDLRTAVSKKAVMITNQNGYDEMDNMADGNGRAFLKPDVSGDFEHFKGRRVIYGDNDVIEDIEENGTAYAPLYVGSLADFVSLFIRKGMRMDMTNVGGDAWETGGYEIRCMCQMDCKTVDETAMVKRGIQQA